MPAILHFNTDFTSIDEVNDDRLAVLQNDYIQHFISIASEKKAIDQYVFYTGGIHWNDKWEVQYFLKRICSGESHSAQIGSAFIQVFENDPGPVIALLSNTAEISLEVIRDAFLALEKKDLIFGRDGIGTIQLLGLRSLPTQLEDGNAWILLDNKNTIEALCHELNWNFQALELNTAARSASSEEGANSV